MIIDDVGPPPKLVALGAACAASARFGVGHMLSDGGVIDISAGARRPSCARVGTLSSVAARTRSAASASRIACTCSRTADALCTRCSGALAIIVSTSSASGSGTWLGSIGGGSLKCIVITTLTDESRNGGRPDNIS